MSQAPIKFTIVEIKDEESSLVNYVIHTQAFKTAEEFKSQPDFWLTKQRKEMEQNHHALSLTVKGFCVINQEEQTSLVLCVIITLTLLLKFQSWQLKEEVSEGNRGKKEISGRNTSFKLNYT